MAPMLGALARIWPRSSSAAPAAHYRASPAACVASGGRYCSSLARSLPVPWRARGRATGARASSRAVVGSPPQPGRAPVTRRMAAPSEAKRVSASLPCPAEYRANVGICLANRSGLVFVASRIDKPGAWQMPQGGIDGGEEPEAAARRELREETGVVSADLIAEVPDWLCYDFPPDVRAKLAVAWGKDWKGQAQKWFLFRYTGADDSEVCLTGDGSEKPEFDSWKWMDVPSVIEAAVSFKRPVYEAAFRVFQPYLQ